MKNRSTIQIPKELREELKKAKNYPRETYKDQIERMLRKERKI